MLLIIPSYLVKMTIPFVHTSRYQKLLGVLVFLSDGRSREISFRLRSISRVWWEVDINYEFYEVRAGRARDSVGAISEGAVSSFHFSVSLFAGERLIEKKLTKYSYL